MDFYDHDNDDCQEALGLGMMGLGGIAGLTAGMGGQDAARANAMYGMQQNNLEIARAFAKVLGPQPNPGNRFIVKDIATEPVPKGPMGLRTMDVGDIRSVRETLRTV